MSDALFPSGEWTGFYTYEPRDRHRMDLFLTFAQGTLNGEGRDDVGSFLIRGQYDAAGGECHWTKTYPGSHDVYYQGYREGKGIYGRWEIGLLSHGGFHIWPKGVPEGVTEIEEEEEPRPVEAVGKPAEALPAR